MIEWSTTRSTGTSGSMRLGVLPSRGGDVAHRGQVGQQRHAGEVLQHHARHDERDLVGALGVGLPVGELPHVLGGDLLAVAVAQHRLQHDAQRHRQARRRWGTAWPARAAKRTVPLPLRADREGLQRVGEGVGSWRAPASVAWPRILQGSQAACHERGARPRRRPRCRSAWSPAGSAPPARLRCARCRPAPRRRRRCRRRPACRPCRRATC